MSSAPGPRDTACVVPRGRVGPRTLRGAALALPAVATIAGYTLPTSRGASAVVRLAALALPGGAIALALAERGGRLERTRRGRGSEAPFRAIPEPHHDALVTVLVPARDESAVIARLIADIGAARSDPLALIVIDDASCDGMADLADAAIEASGLTAVARVVRLATPSGGKGAALAAVPPPTSGVVVVLDADARVTPDFIATVRAVASSTPAAQARRRMLRPAADCDRERRARLLALLQDGEQEIDALISRARLRIGGAAEFRGDGMVIRAEALRGLGGWPSDALCEDLELATRWYLATGLGVQRPGALEIWEQPVLTIGPLISQRLRWAEGSIRRDLRLVLPALADARRPARRRVELAAYASQALVPWVVLGLAGRAFRSRSGRRSAGHRDGAAAQGVERARVSATDPAAVATLGSVVAGYALAALVLAWASQAAEAGQTAEPIRPEEVAPIGHAEPGSNAGAPARSSLRGTDAARRIARAVVVTAFTGLWALVLPVAWLRVAVRPGSPPFVRTPHTTPTRFSEPGSDPPRRT